MRFHRQNMSRTLNWTMRAKLACDVTRPKAELPTVVFGARKIGVLNPLTASILNWAFKPSKIVVFLSTERSHNRVLAERTPIVRGALPKVFAAADEKAAGFNHPSIRSASEPGVRG